MDFPTFQASIEKLSHRVIKLDISYHISDGRCWTAIINPDTDNILVTYIVNRYVFGDHCFDVLASDTVLADVSPDFIVDCIATAIDNNRTSVSNF